jgi:hypothetical protein
MGEISRIWTLSQGSSTEAALRATGTLDYRQLRDEMTATKKMANKPTPAAPAVFLQSSWPSIS